MLVQIIALLAECDMILGNWTISKGLTQTSSALNLALGVGRENSCKVMQKLFFIPRAVPNPPKTSFFHRRTVPPFLSPLLYTT